MNLGVGAEILREVLVLFCEKCAEKCQSVRVRAGGVQVCWAY
jgi:hypothetical protein